MLMKNGSKGEDVRFLQYGLRILCCYPGEIDGSFGSGTEAGVMKFQQSFGLKADGIVGDMTWNSLQMEILPIQKALQSKKVFHGVATGIAKENTLRAVQEFQKRCNLKSDGMVGTETRARLFSADTKSREEAALPLSTGSQGDYVQNLQYGLRILCCSPGAADGVYGAGTEAAVRKFQERYGLSVTGITDRETWEQLKRKITRIQRALSEKGYGAALTEGLAGAALMEKIKDFQGKNYLTADGQVGPSTEALLLGSGENAGDQFPLKLHSRGPQVLYLQYALRISCINPNGTDGAFGSGTEAAVNRYKAKHGMSADGQMDIAAWERLRSEIRPIQTALAGRGYAVGSIDGIATEAVYKAVLQFQKDQHMNADGMVGTQTKALLFGGGDGKGTVSSTLRPGSNGSLCRYMQNMLSMLGFSVRINGIFDEATRNAILQFQKDHGMEPDGVVGRNTWKALFDAYLPKTMIPGAGIERLVRSAERELSLGFAEDNKNNITPYGEWYGLNGESWCAMFLSFVAAQAGSGGEETPRFAYCPDAVSWYKKRNRYHKRGSGYIPKKSDFIFFFNFAKGRVAHTGIVVGGDREHVRTIEGNTAFDDVHARTYDLDNIAIDGYGDNGGEPIYSITEEGPYHTEAEYQEEIQRVVLELVEGLGFQILPPRQIAENVDISLYESPELRVTIKASRGSSMYLGVNSPFTVDFEYGVPSVFGVNLSPHFSVAFNGDENKEIYERIIGKMTLGDEKTPVKFSFEAEGEWLKLSYIVEQTIFKGDVHEDTISYSCTLWVNSRNQKLAPAMQKVDAVAFQKPLMKPFSRLDQEIALAVLIGIAVGGATAYLLETGDSVGAEKVMESFFPAFQRVAPDLV